MKNKRLLLKLVLVLTSLLIIGCPGSKRDELEFLRSRVDSLRNVINNFLLEENYLKYQSYINNKPFQITPLYTKYNNLFSQLDISLINELLKLEQRPERIDRLERLKSYVYGRIVDKATSKLQDEIVKKRHEIRYLTKFGTVGECDLDFSLAYEPDQSKRKKLYEQNRTIYEELEKLNFKLLSEKKRIILDSLRFNSYNQFASMVRQIDLDVYSEISKKFIETTNGFYSKLLNDVLKSRRFPYYNLKAYDISYVLSTSKFDRYFKKDSLLSILKNSYNLIGLPIDSLHNLSIILNESKSKKIDLSRPSTKSFILSVPEDLKIYLRVEQGFESYYSSFYHSGYILNMAMSKEKSLELKYFGSEVINHTIGTLLANQTDELKWLDNNIFSTKSLISNYGKIRALKKLYDARWLCAKFLIKYDILTQDTLDLDSTLKFLNYALELSPSRTTLYKITSSLYDYYQELDQIRAIFIEAMMKTKVREKFGNEWFKNSDLGNYLSKFLEKGKKYTVTEFLKDIGFYEVEPRFFYNEIIALSGKQKFI